MSARSLWSDLFNRRRALPLTIEEKFEQRLRRFMPSNIQLKINDNRSTILSIRGRLFSVHRLFLDAPDEVLKELARYAMGRRTKPLLRRYIQAARVTCSGELDLDPKGRVYDLSEMMEEINSNYFDEKLDLKIGWFGREQKRRRQITFGQYLADHQAIKIHRLLDDPFYPRYFVAFVVYHEMLHAVIPGYHDENGRFRLHGPEFKEREKKFHAYSCARRFEKANREKIFGWA